MKINYSYTLIFLVSLSIFFNACISSKPYYDKSQLKWKSATVPDSIKLTHSVFLIGDVGIPDKTRQEPTLRLLQQQIFNTDSLDSTYVTGNMPVNNSRKEDVVIFLGDNVYETGMPKPDASDRKEKERRITEQMNVVKNFKGHKIFIPGNHDWNESRPGGYDAIIRQEQFIEQYLDSADVFLPSNGCGGPVEVNVGNNLVIIVIDSEWFLSKYYKPLAPDNGCASTSRLDMMQQIKDIVLRNKGKNIILAQHHPLFSNGRHGGYFTLKDYIFPLTLVRDNYYIPLPIVGSIYPLMRQYGVSRQDLSNKDYQQLKRGLISILEDEENIVIASGHEHALQFTKSENINQVISGAGSKRSTLAKGNEAMFAHGSKGFARLNYYNNGQCWLEFWEPNEDGSKGTLMYKTPLYAISPKTPKTKAQVLVDYRDSTKTSAAEPQFTSHKFKRNLLGEHYRDVWATPVKMKYLDLANFAGGLTPIKMGGGKQTTSLQLEGKDKNIYQFRTISKDPSALLPQGFKKTFAEDLVQDQISSAHPYGALIIPDMAKAIGIYHTEPQLVYMPYSSLLGPYIEQVGGKIGIIEVRPDEDVSDFKNFGNAKNAVSTRKMYEELQEDNDNEVDQEMFLRARLFDILIGDWDRHEDQWRWAEFKKKKGSIYRPIPRDRDQAFTKFDGIIPSMISKILPDIQSFTPKIKNVADLSIAARNLDRNLLNQLSEDDWKRIAGDVKNKLTDSIIESSVKKMPPEVFKASGEEIITKLKSRRNELPKVADDYYKILSKEVRVTGTDKKEFFKVERQKNKTNLSVYKITKDEGVVNKIFERSFNDKDTKELNLFALDNKDSIVVTGKGSAIKLRIIGGSGEDVIIDNSKSGRVIVYDDKAEDNKIKEGFNTAVRLSKNEIANEFDRNYFTYDRSGKIPSVDYNGEDLIFLGLGVSMKHHGFRKDPYSIEQKVYGNIAPYTGAFNLGYNGTFYSLFAPRFDLIFNATYNNPKYKFGYYGIGNSTANPDDNVLYHRTRSENLSIASYLQYRFTKVFNVGIGPGFEYYNITKTNNRFITSSDFKESADILSASKFLTTRAYINLNFVNDNIFPTSGIRWFTEANYLKELKGITNDNFLQLKSDISFYGTPNYDFPVTAAIKLGAATNIGDYKFFQANSLGSNTNLRGFRNNRFAGRSYLYQNSELRFKVENFRNYIFTGNFGLFGFFDSGRVFSDVSESNTWHYGYGPGAWINFYNKFMVSASYGISKESGVVNLKTGISF